MVKENYFFSLFYSQLVILKKHFSYNRLSSWQIGILIRAATLGHFPNYGFIFVTLGSTAVLLITWRALLYVIIPMDNNKKSDVYRRGSPFELFEVCKIFMTLNLRSICCKYQSLGLSSKFFVRNPF